jgi:hypothetical protein
MKCPDARMVDHHTQAIQDHSNKTSKEIIHGPDHWIPPPHHACSPTAGHQGAVATLLTTAFHEQYNSISWFYFFRGQSAQIGNNIS